MAIKGSKANPYTKEEMIAMGETPAPSAEAYYGTDPVNTAGLIRNTEALKPPVTQDALMLNG